MWPNEFKHINSTRESMQIIPNTQDPSLTVLSVVWQSCHKQKIQLTLSFYHIFPWCKDFPECSSSC